MLPLVDMKALLATLIVVKPATATHVVGRILTNKRISPAQFRRSAGDSSSLFWFSTLRSSSPEFLECFREAIKRNF